MRARRIAKAEEFAPGYARLGCLDCGTKFHSQVLKCACLTPPKPPRLCARCSTNIDDRPPFKRYCSGCSEIAQRDMREANRLRSLAANIAAHRSKPPQRCPRCGVLWSPLYGTKPGAGGLYRCDPCRDAHALEQLRRRKRQDNQKRGGSPRSRAKKAGVHLERFNPIDVLHRDGWTCQMCGISTPRELRGTTDPAAPEVDHIIPLARKGPHTMDNCQCLCRACNSAKGDAVMSRQGVAHVVLGAK